MPAIQLGKLKAQAAHLAEHFHQPKAFVHHFTDLLEFYADRTQRPNPLGTPRPVVPSYDAPKPVLQRVLFELQTPSQQDPQAALALVDALWARPSLEHRSLAVQALGQIPPDQPQEIIRRLEAWNRENAEDTLLKQMAECGTAGLRAEAPQRFMEALEGWLTSADLDRQKLGVRTLGALVEDETFDNLPEAYRLLAASLEKATPDLRVYLHDTLQPLIKRSPPETAYFLLQRLEKRPDPTSKWLARRSLKRFAPETQARLRKALED